MTEILKNQLLLFTFFQDLFPWSDMPEKEHVKTKKELREEKMRAKHQKKMPQRPDRPRRRPGRPSIRDETPAGGASHKELEGLTAEEAEEAWDEFEERRLSEMEQQILSHQSLESKHSGSMGQLVSFGSSSTTSSQRRRTMHVEMLENRTAMLAKEKEMMVEKMKDKLRKHREHYSQMMAKKRREVKNILPNKPNFFSYYAQREKLEHQYDEETSTETSSSEDMTSLSAQSSVDLLKDSTSIISTSERSTRVTSTAERTQIESRVRMSKYQISADLPKESTKTISRLEESRIISTSEGIQSESGVVVGDHESSCQFTDSDTKKGETGALSSSGFITDQESLTQDATVTSGRPKSSLTVENVQRLEAKSAKEKKKKKKKKKKLEKKDVKPKKEIKAPGKSILNH